VLDRGYALVYDGSRRLIKTPKNLHPGDALHLRFAHGQADASVTNVEPQAEQNTNEN
jgi:exodeoxyribonuclease VII large subunit